MIVCVLIEYIHPLLVPSFARTGMSSIIFCNTFSRPSSFYTSFLLLLLSPAIVIQRSLALRAVRLANSAIRVSDYLVQDSLESQN